jgi:hypothetical protein
MKNIKTMKEIFIFALPVITRQISQMLFGVAAGIFAPFLVVSIGLLLYTGPLAAEIKVRGDNNHSLLFQKKIHSLHSQLEIML